MIVVKLEIWPHGSEADAYPIGRIYIWQKVWTTLKNSKRGDYAFAVMRRGHESSLPTEGPVTRKGTVLNYPRLSYNVWRLIVRVLKEAFPEEQ